MKKLLLFPHRFRTIGYVMVLPFLSLALGFLIWDYTLPWLDYQVINKGIFQLSSNNFTDELAAAGLILSLLFIGFSEEKMEDEAIGYFRLEAMQWAIYANYFVLLLAILFCYGEQFLNVMIINLFTVLVIFIFRFRFVLFMHNKTNA